MAHDDMAWADLAASEDPVLIEWLEGASCGPHVKAIVVHAVHVSDRRHQRRAVAPRHAGRASGRRGPAG